MAKLKAQTLVWHCRTPKGWKRFPVVNGKNNRIRPGYVMEHGRLRHYPEGRYQLRQYRDRKTVYTTLGASAIDAQSHLDRERSLTNAKAAAKAAGVVLEVSATHSESLTLRRQCLAFVEDAMDRKAFEAAEMNNLVVEEFLRVTGRTYANQIVKEDIFSFHRALRKRGCSERTVSNKHKRLRSFFIFIKLDHRNWMPPPPKFDKTLPEVFPAKQLEAIQSAADPYMSLVIGLGLKCGLREQEIMHLELNDVDFEEGVLRVRSKPAYKFKIKDSEERDVPVPQDVLAALRDWHEANPHGRLILPSPSGKPNGHLLRKIKRLARDAGLNCGVCAGCLGDRNECETWYLHKLRATYATTLLRNGVDLSTVQRFMGHSDLASTMRYLRPASATEAQFAINNIKWS